MCSSLHRSAIDDVPPSLATTSTIIQTYADVHELSLLRREAGVAIMATLLLTDELGKQHVSVLPVGKTTLAKMVINDPSVVEPRIPIPSGIGKASVASAPSPGEWRRSSQVSYRNWKRLAEQRPRIRGQFVRQNEYETISREA